MPEEGKKQTILEDAKQREEQSTVAYIQGETKVSLRYDPTDQAFWATTQDIADIFETDIRNIRKHIQNIYQDQELQESRTSAKIALVQIEGERTVVREVLHYNLDVILSVGYRVNSKRATAFRQWATNTLRAFIEQGYLINEKVLRDSPEKLNELAARIRALRFDEKQVYAQVRECFRISSSDYDSKSPQVRTFYALLQDKFHHAITEMTSSKLIMDRADHRETNMGLQSLMGDFPTLLETKTGKNYLKADELYKMHLLSEQFLLYAESTALRKKSMTMESLHRKLDELLAFNDYPVLEGYKDYLKDKAFEHAKKEYALYQRRLYIESQGYEYDEFANESGEYDDLFPLNGVAFEVESGE